MNKKQKEQLANFGKEYPFRSIALSKIEVNILLMALANLNPEYLKFRGFEKEAKELEENLKQMYWR